LWILVLHSADVELWEARNSSVVFLDFTPQSGERMDIAQRLAADWCKSHGNRAHNTEEAV